MTLGYLQLPKGGKEAERISPRLSQGRAGLDKSCNGIVRNILLEKDRIKSSSSSVTSYTLFSFWLTS